VNDTSDSAHRLQAEVLEIAEVLLRQSPPGTTLMDIWEEALTLHRVRYDTEILPPDLPLEREK
jgi:hypothetical protein